MLITNFKIIQKTVVKVKFSPSNSLQNPIAESHH